MLIFTCYYWYKNRIKATLKQDTNVGLNTTLTTTNIKNWNKIVKVIHKVTGNTISVDNIIKKVTNHYLLDVYTFTLYAYM